MEHLEPLILVTTWAIVHVIAGKLRFLDVIPRSRWLSLAGGISVAYVFFHILPELDEAHDPLRALSLFSSLARPSHVIAFCGLVTFYGLERLAIRSRGEEEADAASSAVFWIHMGSFSLYNAIAAYLLVRRPGETSMVLYAAALGVHFVVNDFGLRHHHKRRYDRLGRWILAASLFGGWTVGLLDFLPRPSAVLLFAFLAGGIVMNVLKEELPERRASRFWPFALGGIAYGALILALG